MILRRRRCGYIRTTTDAFGRLSGHTRRREEIVCASKRLKLGRKLMFGLCVYEVEAHFGQLVRSLGWTHQFADSRWGDSSVRFGAISSSAAPMGKYDLSTNQTKLTAFLIICFLLLLTGRAHGQDVEPRRWTPLPVGINIIGAAYGYSTGDVAFDPVLKIEDAKVDLHTVVFSYSRTLGLFGRSARFDALVPLQHATWEGLLDGAPASVSREGFADPAFRLSVNLFGAPAAGMEEFQKRAVAQPVSTVIGAAISVGVPLGEYFEDKLLNLGQNRYVFRPQIGVLHTRGKWSYELTGSTYFFTDNDEFFGGNTLKQEPVHALQAHVIRVFKPGLWASVSAAYGWRGETTVNDVPKNNDKIDVLAALSVGLPITQRQGIKLVYLRSQTHRITGADLETLMIAWSTRF